MEEGWRPATAIAPSCWSRAQDSRKGSFAEHVIVLLEQAGQVAGRVGWTCRPTRRGAALETLIWGRAGRLVIR